MSAPICMREVAALVVAVAALIGIATALVSHAVRSAKGLWEDDER